MTNSGHIIDHSVAFPTAFKPEDVTVNDLRHLAKDSFALWVLTSGCQPDNNVFDFDKHRYLLPMYMDGSEEIVWRKAAQLGATVYMMLRLLWWLESHQGRKAGLYFPTAEGVQNLSKDRLTPLIESCPTVKAIADPNDKLGLRKIGTASLYMYHIAGTASKDSVPLDYLSFDEVRLMQTKDIDQTMHRISHSPYKMKVLMSTCGLPDDTIDRLYKQGKKYAWRSACGCPDGCNLAETFPSCVVHDDPKRKDPYLRCPKCKWEIKDPQNGRYIAENPSADFNSYHVSQLVSKYRSLKDIWREYSHTTNMEEFYNATLGLPFIDAANKGVSLEDLEKCVNPELKWAKDENKRDIEPTAMGIDQGAGYCMVVIADLNKDRTKKRIRHVEIIEDVNPYYMINNERVSPFIRCSELMKQFNVQMCLTDGMPNFNDALSFAQRHPGKVFLAYYAEAQKETVRWLDRPIAKENIRKAGPFLKFKYVASLGRFPSLSVALGEWAEGNVEIPHPDAIRQFCIDEKTRVVHPESPARRLFAHLPRLVKRWHETDPETGKGKWEWIYVGGDPHLAHAFNYCNIALERLKKKPIYTFA